MASRAAKVRQVPAASSHDDHSAMFLGMRTPKRKDYDGKEQRQRLWGRERMKMRAANQLSNVAPTSETFY